MIYSVGLVCDIPDAELMQVSNIGYKPNWLTPDLILAEVEKISSRDRYFQQAAVEVEAQIAGDMHAAGCINERVRG